MIPNTLTLEEKSKKKGKLGPFLFYDHSIKTENFRN